MSSKKKSASNGDAIPAEVPIFLQKTYHMIDTCPPQIATWSTDGLTFLVRDTHLFETTIIPQFFKHSKFSSFVRQLNFYGFRKIRFQDSLKIDLEREKSERNFWRFKHESFRRGRVDLLTEIKRSASSSSSSNNGVGKGGQLVNGATATAAVGGNGITSPQEVSRLNKEVTVLKEQMQSMSTKMEDLTSLVKDMKVASPPIQQQRVEEEVQCGNKRKKLATTTTTTIAASTTATTAPTTANTTVKLEQDVDMMSFPDLEDAANLLPDLALSSGPSSFAPSPILSRSSSLNGVMDRDAVTSSSGVQQGEEDFVDELFHAFATDDDVPPPPSSPRKDDNRPDPQLMKRIEDSLATIPKTMHEMVANRLIDAIAEGNSSSNVSASGSSIGSSCSSSGVDAMSPSSVSIPTIASADAGDVMEGTVHSPSSVIPESAADTTTTTSTTNTDAEKATIPLPLAVATLKTILADYGLKVECRSSSEDANLHRRLSNKSLPLVPMHA